MEVEMLGLFEVEQIKEGEENKARRLALFACEAAADS